MNKKNSGTSVLEILTTVAIIFILATLLVSAIYSTREKGKMAMCINNLKNLTAALIMTAIDEEEYPTELTRAPRDDFNTSDQGLTLHQTVQGFAFASTSDYYSHQMGITQCPKISGMTTDNPPTYSYGINQLIRGVSYQNVQDTSKIIVATESTNKTVVGTIDDVSFRHMGQAFAGFADGHVEIVRFSDLANASEDMFGSTTSQGASGNGVLFRPESTTISEEGPSYIAVTFSFTQGSVCSNGFRWDFMGLTDNGDGTSTFAFNITNSNNKALSNASFGLPEDVSAVSPADDSIYTAGNKNYQVENTTENPFHAIKFNTIAEGIKNGQMDTFSFTLDNDDVGSVIIMRVQSKGGQIIGNGQFDAGESGSGSTNCPS